MQLMVSQLPSKLDEDSGLPVIWSKTNIGFGFNESFENISVLVWF